MMVKEKFQSKLAKSMLIKLHVDQSLRESIIASGGGSKKNLPMASLMIWTSALVIIMMIISTKQFFMKLLWWKTKGWKVTSDSKICVIKIDYWKGCIRVKKGSSLFDCKWMYLCQASSEWWLYLHACKRLRLIFDCNNWNTCIKYHAGITFVLVTWKIWITLYKQ